MPKMKAPAGVQVLNHDRDAYRPDDGGFFEAKAGAVAALIAVGCALVTEGVEVLPVAEEAIDHDEHMEMPEDTGDDAPAV